MAWLDDPDLIKRRRQSLADAHVAQLECWREGLLADGRPVPHFDPADGGVDARLLLLLETPGPGPERTRFVSRDNQDENVGRDLVMIVAARQLIKHFVCRGATINGLV